MSPAPTSRHQHISRRLANLLDPGADAAGLWARDGQVLTVESPFAIQLDTRALLHR